MEIDEWVPQNYDGDKQGGKRFEKNRSNELEECSPK